ncbi:hypothetical protein [Bacteroides sp.]|uniref:hypothetical protein n=1 Tax=Bacteroides sp. TaxID=29523 RepID=UPI00261969C8|nr:hypothetical protein [Bacteroides sp.]
MLSISRSYPPKACVLSHWYIVYYRTTPIGYARICQWKRSYLLLETSVSASGYACIRRWGRPYPLMGTIVSAGGNGGNR